MNPEQQAANLRSAANLTRTQLNLPDDPQTWTLDQRAAYNKALAAQILKYPGAFSQEARATNEDESARMTTHAGPGPRPFVKIREHSWPLRFPAFGSFSEFSRISPNFPQFL